MPIGPTEMLILLPLLVGLLVGVLAVVDIARSGHEPGVKLGWVAVVLFFPCVGALAYLIVGRKR
jgi:hypothetical protein